MMKKKKSMILVAVLLALTLLTAGCGDNMEEGNPNKVKLDPENPVTITVWHYYNSAQQEAFNQLVKEFNDTEGKEKGIIVESFSQGNVSDLENSVLDAADKKVGAGEIPNIFAAYADTAYAVDKLGLVVDLDPYLSDAEKDRFVGSYLEEGRFSTDGSIKIFPVAKSTEIFMLNKTDWDKFEAATGASLDRLKTMEGLVATAKDYYEWTDSLTPLHEDGKAFFGRDAMANYFLIGAKQLGVEIFSLKDGKPVLNFDKEVVHKLWDNYYIPYVKGYFSASGRFRSDNIKTGSLIAMIGSSSGATYFPKEVILNDNESYPIEMSAYECPQFSGSEKFAVQQGAGMVVTQDSDAEMYASVEFLKWITQDDANIRFSISSGYLPVTKTANDMTAIKKAVGGDESFIAEIIETSINTVNDNTLYTTKAFENGTKARNILEYAMADKAAVDRAAVVQSLKSGASLADAVAPFESQENFESWYEEAKTALESQVK